MSSGLLHVLPAVEPSGASPDAQAIEANDFKLGDFAIDEYRPMKVIVIGAGFSGIYAAIRLPQRVPNVEFVVYDQNESVGGTWSANRYPGISCDIPSHAYTFTFEPNPYWSAFYAPGQEIREYIQGVADKYKCMQYIKLRHRVIHAEWNAGKSKWKLRVQKLDSDVTHPEIIEDEADVVLSCTGLLSRWTWPSIPGLRSFKGQLVHSADWNLRAESSKEAEKFGKWLEAGKRIAVIGVGSSAIQIVPALQPRAKHLVNFVRGKTWIAKPFGSDKLNELMGQAPDVGNYQYSAEDQKRFAQNPEEYQEFRLAIEQDQNSVHPVILKGSAMQEAGLKLFRATMREKLAKKPWIADHLIPDFPVGCRRLTPGPGYLEALCEDNVDFVSCQIKSINANGIETEDGQQRDFDIIVCATGFDTSSKPHYTVVGENGVTLDEKYDPYPKHYLSIATDGFPNWWNSFGPNSAVSSGSLIAMYEHQVNYAIMAIRKMQRERITAIFVKREAVEDYDKYIDAFFPMTVYGDHCRAWYKGGREDGRVVGLWPGSCLHSLAALAHPRWEDFNFVRMHPNRFHWLGDGQTWNEKTMSGDRAWYLRPEYVDRPPVPT